MATSLRNPGQLLTLASTIAAATPEGSLVVIDTTADDTAMMPTGADQITPLLGLLRYASHPTAANQPVEVVIEGVFPGIAGSSITRGQEVSSFGTNGRVKTAAAVAGTNVAVLGTAMESAAAGERVAIRIHPYVKQG